MQPQEWRSDLANTLTTFIPDGLGVQDFFADFLHYMKGWAQEWIYQTHPNGRNLWAETISEAKFILTFVMYSPLQSSSFLTL